MPRDEQTRSPVARSSPSPPASERESRGWGLVIAAVIAAAVVSIVGRRLAAARSGGRPPRRPTQL